jgi:amino acid transporter
MIGRLTDLNTLIQLLTTVMILVQSVAQIVSLLVLRKTKPHLARPYKMWLYPVPALIALLGWVYIYMASNHNAPGAYPIQWSLVWVLAGSVAYLFWARVQRLWPFNK